MRGNKLYHIYLITSIIKKPQGNPDYIYVFWLRQS